MKKLSILPAIAALQLVHSALGQSPDDGGEPASASASSEYESPGLLPSDQFVPGDKMSGPLHRVSDQTWNDGLRNSYNVATRNGQVVEVTTTLALLKRIAEIYAINTLENQSKTEEFGKAMAAAGRKSLESAMDAVTDPVGTIRRVPQGASRFFGRIGEGLKGGESERDGDGHILKSIVGIDKAKAKLAMQLGVSPYSQNRELQKQLDDAALAIAGGGLVFKAGTAAIGSAVISVLGMNEALQSALVDSSAADLRIRNRNKLLELGVDRALADAFLSHAWYDPWVATILVDALGRIGADPSSFLRKASEALAPEDASYFLRLAQILASYHENAAALKSLPVENGIPCGLDTNGTLVVPVSLDYAIWDARTAGRAEQFGTLVAGSETLDALAVWTDGQLSPRLQKALTARQIDWQMEVLSGVR